MSRPNNSTIIPVMLKVPKGVSPGQLAGIIRNHPVETLAVFDLNGRLIRGPIEGEFGRVQIPEAWKTEIRGAWVVHSHTTPRPASKADLISASFFGFGILWIVLPNGKLLVMDPGNAWPDEAMLVECHTAANDLAMAEFEKWRGEQTRRRNGSPPEIEDQNRQFDQCELEHQLIQFSKSGVIIKVEDL